MTIDTNNPNWMAELKEARRVASLDPRVQRVYEWALAHYEQGGDVIVEAFEPDEVLELVAEADTPEAAIKRAAEYCGLRREVENDVRGYGELPPLLTL